MSLKLLALVAVTSTGLVCYGALKLLTPFLRQLSSPLHRLKGPEDKGSFLFGNFPDVDSGRARDWIEEHGKVIKVRGLFWVRQKLLHVNGSYAQIRILANLSPYSRYQSSKPCNDALYGLPKGTVSKRSPQQKCRPR